MRKDQFRGGGCSLLATAGKSSQTLRLREQGKETKVDLLKGWHATQPKALSWLAVELGRQVGRPWWVPSH